MCGISGYFLADHLEISAEKILQMTRAIAFRGPDDEGLTLFSGKGSNITNLATTHTAQGVLGLQAISKVGSVPHRIAFGHRRFSIVDISPSGHQPFWSKDCQVCVVFNGEIYNYVELRQKLKSLGHTFYTDSDTEVLVEAYLEWGTDCFQHFNGFWALSLYDTRKNAVLLARDRIGVSPLYIAQTAKGLFWSSEIKGIFAALGSSAFSICDQSVFDFVQYSWRDLFDTTFYEGIVTFPRASYAWIQEDGSYHPQSFWQLSNQRLRERDICPTEAIQKLRHLLTDAVSIRLRADVPVGVELSGGMDSSSISAIAAHSGNPIETFTVSFPGTEADEESFARKVAEYYQDRLHYNVFVPPPNDLFTQADQYIELIEEPFHSPNLLTHQSIWREMADKGIRVSLHGGAGDEVLAGYAGEYHSLYLQMLLRQGSLLPFIREFLLYSEARSKKFGLGYASQAYRLLPQNLQILKRPQINASPSLDPFIVPQHIDRLGASSDLHQRLIDNMGDWRMNYWMRSSNKSAMGIPIELRFPFLDYRIVDFAFSLPISYLVRQGWMKWILRQGMKDILPPEVAWRKVKAGFPFPYTQWLLTSKSRFCYAIGSLDCPYLNWQQLSSESYEHLAYNNPLYLWRMMSLALWWKKCVQGESLQ
ncbi:MAG: asparagine synthase (glutamine-hydrolyzing) [Acaryochloris sp. RU_4_1]|nr:asparagine synthase (glutamine-hydrolyzing) [Acaryochloris sp. RU_4_1]NJR53342.1 asparagine synthase (glutamine-hydrolyzing) [Acaryochloris sp. CRU_2_0]